MYASRAPRRYGRCTRPDRSVALHSLLIAASVLASMATTLPPSTFDNEAGHYALTALPEADREAERMDRMQLCDQQPAGLHVRKGETVTVVVDSLPEGHYLDVLIGFRPMWGVAQDQQEEQLDAGETEFVAEQDGPLYFRFNSTAGHDARRDQVIVDVSGGRPLPLYVDATMDADDWEAELAAHADAPFVQLLGERALITLPAAVHARDPVTDPQATFAAIDDVLRLQDELAGFDGSSARDRPTRLRQHYLVDFRASKKDRDSFYMYATDQFIGMLPDNAAELTDPEQLRREWGIWHETGHTHQQNSWTWEALGEINVNLFSLYVQESFGLPSTLAEREDGAPSRLDRVGDYLAAGSHDLLAEPSDDAWDGDEMFLRLVMFHQLKEVYGWELFQELHKHFRAHPLDGDASDQDKADAFVAALCELTGVDLRPFFETWGLRVSPAADARIDAAGYQLPDQDYSLISE